MSIRIKRRKDNFFHVHSHSRFSYGDALPTVQDMVAKVVQMEQPALALTDHGNMAGSVQLYRECAKAGIKPFPGEEFYFVKTREEKDAKRRHMGIVAFSSPGYEALVKLSSLSHRRDHFHHKPLIDFSDLAEWKENGWTDGLALTTGCFFGLVTQTLVNEGEDACKHVLRQIGGLFPHTFVELQNHNINHVISEECVYSNDGEIAGALLGIANELGLPVVLTQDSHYCDPTDKVVHEGLKRLVSYGPDPDDALFPGDGFHLCDSNWIREHHEDRAWIEGQRGFGHLLDLHSLAIPELDQYKYNIPHVTQSPTSELKEVVTTELESRKLGQRYGDQLLEELSVIEDTGMAGYLLLVKEVTDWCVSNGVFFQTRGSASGSITCWLLGITQLDPLKYKLRFERFISRDRTKPPDIDLDVEDTRRDDLLEWLASRFNVCQIGTWGEYSIDDKEGRGSLIVAAKKRMRQLGAGPEELDAVKTLSDLPLDVGEELRAVSDRKPFKGYGTHAAGIVITTTRDEFSRLVPTMLVASSGTTVSQYNGDDIESLGLVKLDVLGLRTLSLLRSTVRLLGRDVGDGLDFIPMADARTFTTVRNGATAGVFQLEGGTARRGCREIQTRSLKDIIVTMALFRPAVMSSGGKDTYIRRREGYEKPPNRHPILASTLKETYGIPVFQEQVVQILRDLGFSPDELTDFLKAVKKSNKNVGDAVKTIAGYEDLLGRLCEDKGVGPEDLSFLWDTVKGFAEYGFNRAHASGYGVLAYRCAWLKTHHPLEFATALLETSTTNKEKQTLYIAAVKEMGIRLLSPHVNISTHTWTMDRKRRAIRKGLVSVKGVGPKAAAELSTHAPYNSIEDILERCDARAVTGGKSWVKHKTLNGVLGLLDQAGALEGIK